MNEPVVALAIFAVTVGLYFLPFIIAAARSHKNRLAIFALNLLLGWTLIFWVLSLVWAFTSDTNA